MFRARIAALVLLAQVLQPLAAVAGESASGIDLYPPEGAAADSVSASALALRTIPAGRKIRVLADGVLTTGTFERFVADTLWMLTPPVTLARTVPASSIDGLWERGTAIRTGAAIGTAIGLVTALIVVPGEGVDPEEAIMTEEQVDNTFRALGITLVGGLIGGLVGLAIPRWNQKIPIK